MKFRLALVFVTLLIGLSGCAKPQPIPAPAPPPPAEEPPPPPEPPKLWEMASPASPSVGASAEPVEMTGEEHYLAEFVHQALKPVSAPPTANGILVQAARELSRFTALNQVTPPPDFVDFALQWCGSYDPSVEFLHYSYEIDRNDFSDFKQQLSQWVNAMRERGPLTRFGLGVFHVETKSKTQGTLSYVTLLASRQTLELKPMTKQIDPQSRFYLEGRTVSQEKTLHVFVTFLGETLVEADLPARKDAFKTEFQLPSNRAIYRFEITQIDGEQSRVVASFLLYSKLKPPTNYEVKKLTEPCSDSRHCTALLHEIIDEIRRDRHKSPVAVHPVLSELAQEHTGEMLEYHYSALSDRKGRRLVQRLRQKKLDPLNAVRFVDGDYSMLALLKRVETSPLTLKAVANEHMTHVGCSVAVKNGKNDQNYYALSCGLAVFIDERDFASIRKDILTTLNGIRNRKGLPPLSNCTELATIAQEAAENIQTNPTMMKEFQGEVLAAIEDNGYDGRRLTFHVLTLYHPSQIETTSAAKEIVESQAREVAIGVQRPEDREKQTKGILVYLIAAY